MEEKGKTDDTRVYLFDNGYRLYKLVKIGRNSVSALRMRTRPYEPLMRMPDFATIGIFETEGTFGEVERILKTQIKGKIIMIENVAITIPFLILEEAC